jgi:hypothetical protein
MNEILSSTDFDHASVIVSFKYSSHTAMAPLLQAHMRSYLFYNFVVAVTLIYHRFQIYFAIIKEAYL